MVVVILAQLLIPLFKKDVTNQAYNISPQARELIGNSSVRLSKKISFDTENKQFLFNKDYSPDANKASVGEIGYKANFSEAAEKGVTITDVQNELDITLIPQFDLLAGKQNESSIVYPLKNSQAQLVYSLKGTGVKEDVVLKKYTKKRLVFDYQLKLPDGAEARLLANGELGVYVGDLRFFGNVSTGSDSDKDLLDKARKNATKDQLVFSLPAPFIKEIGGKKSSAKASYEYKDNILSIIATDLDKASYPLSVDPTIKVTSTSDFAFGNNEENIDFDTTDSINRDNFAIPYQTNENVQAVLPTARKFAGVAVYNNFLYITGGDNDGTRIATVHFTKLSSGGDFTSPNITGCAAATWCTTTAIPAIRSNHSTVAYNGFIYVISGVNSSNTAVDTIYYAPLNTTDGSIGTWVTDSRVTPASRSLARSVAYNGYLYWSGGVSGGIAAATVHYALFNGDGSMGTFTATSSFTGSRYDHAMATYNNYLYVYTGLSNSGGRLSSIYYAAIKSDGSLETFRAGGNTTVAIYGAGFGVANGYLFTIGGCFSEGILGECDGVFERVQFASINADGSLGTWTALIGTLDTGRGDVVAAANNGHIYTLGGCTGYNALLQCNANTSNLSSRTALLRPGENRPFANEADGNVARHKHSAVAYNGYLYVVGGCSANGCDNDAEILDTIQYTALNTADNGFAAWSTTTTALPTVGTNRASRYGHASVAANGRLFVLGGVVPNSGDTANVFTQDVLSIALDTSTGNTSGSFTTTHPTTSTNARRYLSAAVYKGHIYAIGGENNGTYTSTIEKLVLNEDGTVGGSWSGVTNNLPGNKAQAAVAVNGSYLYVVGGWDGTTIESTVRYSQFDASGNLGTWASTTTTFTTVRRSPNMVITGGNMYVMGGCSSTTDYCPLANILATVYIAPINSDGNITDTWILSVNSQTAVRYYSMAVAQNNSIYIPNGCETLACAGVTSTQISQADNGGMGTTTWVADSDTFTRHVHHTTAIVNGYIYLIGGCTATTVASCAVIGDTGDAYYALLDPTDGSIGTWTETTGPIVDRKRHSSFAYNGRIYIFGGCTDTTCTTKTTTVEYVTPSGSGSLGTWTDNGSQSGGANLPADIYDSTFQAYDGYAYRLGGNVTNTTSATTAYATINSSTGVISSWTAGTSLATARKKAASAIYNGYIYTVSGLDASDNALFSIEVSQISAGVPGAWTTIAIPLNIEREGAIAGVFGGVFYVAGGAIGSTRFGTVLSAQILDNGALSHWSKAGTMVTTRGDFSGAMNNGTWYVTGGSDAAGNSITTAEYGSLELQPRVASYSRLNTVDTVTTNNVKPQRIAYSGAKENATTSIHSLRYLAGPNATCIFGTSTTVTPFDPGTAYTYSPSSNGLDRCFWVRFNLNDNMSMTYPHTSTKASKIDNYDIYFSPSTNKRLRGGKTFTNEVQNNLDAYPR